MGIFQGQYYSHALSRQVPFTVILPADHSSGYQVPVGGFPTIYLLHGFMGCQTDWLYYSTLPLLAREKDIAVVMPAGENSFYFDLGYEGANYNQFVGKELVDYTRMIFPLAQSRRDTAIGGLSMGGFGAVHVGLSHNNTFGAIISLSSAFITDMISDRNPDEFVGMPMPYSSYRAIFGDLKELKDSDRNPKTLASRLVENGGRLPALYMACGTEDFLLEPNREMHTFLEGIGYPHLYLETPGTHDWKFWNEYIAKALEWMDITRKPMD